MREREGGMKIDEYNTFLLYILRLERY